MQLPTSILLLAITHALPILSSAIPREVSEIYKETLSKDKCVDITLEAGHVLHATCTPLAYADGHAGEPVASSLDLNLCLAGSATGMGPKKDGNFAGVCTDCVMGPPVLFRSATVLVCRCAGKWAKIDLDDWDVLATSGGVLGCGGSL